MVISKFNRWLEGTGTGDSKSEKTAKPEIHFN